jgi:hypothetical protein
MSHVFELRLRRHDFSFLKRLFQRRYDRWFRTYTGVKFYPFNPRAADINIEDIAHSLSLQCRFAGHIRGFYSVAEHCVRVSYKCKSSDALWGLLHDAAESYMIDLPRPHKRAGLFGWLYRRTERRIEREVAAAFALPFPISPAVKFIDNRMLMTEARDLCLYSVSDWSCKAVPFPEQITPLSAELAEVAFLQRFNALTTR